MTYQVIPLFSVMLRTPNTIEITCSDKWHSIKSSKLCVDIPPFSTGDDTSAGLLVMFVETVRKIIKIVWTSTTLSLVSKCIHHWCCVRFDALSSDWITLGAYCRQLIQPKHQQGIEHFKAMCLLPLAYIPSSLTSKSVLWNDWDDLTCLTANVAIHNGHYALLYRSSDNKNGEQSFT